MNKPRLVLLLGAALFVMASEWVAATPPEGVLVVTLNPVARPKGTILRLGDMALINGPTHLREKAAGLDVAECSLARKVPSVAKQEVYYRLILAGLDAKSFRLVGPAQVSVRWDEGLITSGIPEKGETPSMEKAPLVKAREMVRLLVRIGTVRVSALGEAQQEGRLGQTIRVRNIDSGKTVSGRVVDRNLVEVLY